VRHVSYRRGMRWASDAGQFECLISVKKAQELLQNAALAIWRCRYEPNQLRKPTSATATTV
jgi:hypothetical protein